MTHYRAYTDRCQCKVKEGLTKNHSAYCSIMITQENERTASPRELILVSSNSLHLCQNLITKHRPQYHEKIFCDFEKERYIITSSSSFLSQVVTSLNLLPCSVRQLLHTAETFFYSLSLQISSSIACSRLAVL